MNQIVPAGYYVPRSVTRTADTNAYLAGDVIGTGTTAGDAVIEFGGLPRQCMMRVLSSHLRIDASALISGEATYRLHLYTGAPVSNLADSGPWDLPAGDRDLYQGSLELGTPVDEGSTLWVKSEQTLDVWVSDGTLRAYLETVAAYTPTSGRVYVPAIYAGVL